MRHIIPVSEGGKDNEDNAITLCWDCHTDAGHYNEKHPKGTKYSQKELKLAKDKLHGRVRKNEINPLGNVDCIHARYLLCQNYETIK